MRLLNSFTAITAILLGSAPRAAAADVRSVYLHDSELWVQDAADSNGHKITFDGLPKSFPAWSANGEKIAFFRGTTARGGEIVVISLSGRHLREIAFRPPSANVSGMRFVEGLQWAADSRIMVFGSINPSTVEYAVFDVASGKQVDGYMADGFSLVPSPDGKHVAYDGYIAHFTPEDRRHSQLCFDHECGFDVAPWRGYPGDAGPHLEFLSKPRWSQDSSEVAILAQDYDSKARLLIVRRLRGTTASYDLPLSAHPPFRVSWGDNAYFVTAADLAWRLDQTTLHLTPIPNESIQDYSRAARELRSTLQQGVERLGGASPDFWCASCPLAGSRVSGNE